MSKPTKEQVLRHEQGEAIYRQILNEMYDLKLSADTPITDVYMEWQKAIRRVFIQEGLLGRMIKVDGEWTLL
jgi:hypothetical protein